MYCLTLSVLLLALAHVNAVVTTGSIHQPHSPVCPYGYAYSYTGCYKVVADAKNWADAQAHCKSTGGFLASPNSQEELDAIVELARQHLSATADNFWLGYTDKQHEGIFQDHNGKVLTHPTFLSGEPNNCCGGEHCLEIYRTHGKMNDKRCGKKVGFICSACPEAVQGCRCPALWQEHGGNCYRFFGSERSYGDSEANCQSYQNGYGEAAHLASVHSEKENKFITELIQQSWPGDGNKRTWLGFDDKRQEGHFEWTDHSAKDYTNWRVNQPDNTNNKEHCLEINWRDPATWNDLPCHLERSSVCKMPVFDPYAACHKLAETIHHLIGQCHSPH